MPQHRPHRARPAACPHPRRQSGRPGHRRHAGACVGRPRIAPRASARRERRACTCPRTLIRPTLPPGRLPRRTRGPELPPVRSRPGALAAPELREWLPEDHLAWFVLESVAELDLDLFYSAYRSDGWGAATHDPQMMVALLIYAYSTGVRSAPMHTWAPGPCARRRRDTHAQGPRRRSENHRAAATMSGYLCGRLVPSVG